MLRKPREVAAGVGCMCVWVCGFFFGVVGVGERDLPIYSLLMSLTVSVDVKQH